MFIFTTNFHQNSENRHNIPPTENKEFYETLEQAISASNPTPGTKIWIRFYDSPNKIGAKYNSVSGDQWIRPNFQWRQPTEQSLPKNCRRILLLVLLGNMDLNLKIIPPFYYLHCPNLRNNIQ